MTTIEELQKVAAQQGFAALTEDVELPVDLKGVDVVLSHVDIQKEWVNGQPTDNLKTRERVDEDTGEVVQQVSVKLTLKLVQAGASAPVKLPNMWFGLDEALALANGVGGKLTVDRLAAVPYVQTYKKDGSTFTSERPAVRWKAVGVRMA